MEEYGFVIRIPKHRIREVIKLMNYSNKFRHEKELFNKIGIEVVYLVMWKKVSSWGPLKGAVWHFKITPTAPSEDTHIYLTDTRISFKLIDKLDSMLKLLPRLDTSL